MDDLEKYLLEEVRRKAADLTEAMSWANSYRYDMVEDPPYEVLKKLKHRIDEKLGHVSVRQQTSTDEDLLWKVTLVWLYGAIPTKEEVYKIRAVSERIAKRRALERALKKYPIKPDHARAEITAQ